MKRKLTQIMGFCLVLGLITALTMAMVGCASTTTTTPTATAASIVSFAVTPLSPGSLTVGATQQFTAIETNSDGTTSDITNAVTWASSSSYIASISSTGVATGIAAGSTNITATLSGVASPAIILSVAAPTPTVTATPIPTLSSITVKPVSPANLTIGSTQQFIATGTYSDSTTVVITSQATWVSSVSTIATISSVGLATGIAAGNTNITATLSGVTSQAIMLTVSNSVSITTSALDDGMVDTAYSQTLDADGGSGNYTWTKSSGTLPSGLTLNISSGVISGTPTTPETDTFMIKVVDSDDATLYDSASFTITISESDSVSITTSSLDDGTVDTAYSQTLEAEGGSGNYTWSKYSGTLPDGLTLNTSTGKISGTPTTADTYTFKIKVVDSDDTTITDTESFTITISESDSVSITTSSLDDGTVNTAYSQTLEAEGGSGNYTWSKYSGTIPDGLTLKTTTGKISGTPTTAGTYTFTIKVVDSNDTTIKDTASFTIIISS